MNNTCKSVYFKYYLPLLRLILIFSILLFLTARLSEAKEPKLQIRSPIAETKASVMATKARLDLSRFLEMENPREAAESLREFLEQKGISLRSSESSLNKNRQSYEINDYSKRRGNENLIHVFSGHEFVPKEGVESVLLDKATKTSLNSMEGIGDEATMVVCIVQFSKELSYGNVVELLELNVKFYEPVGRNAMIVRVLTSSLMDLSSKAFIRWIGEYRAEYKFDSNVKDNSKPGAFIYPLGGDRTEYRDDLKTLGVQLLGYDSSARFYYVILDETRFKELASKLWWVKGIAQEAEEQNQAMKEKATVNFEPDDSRQLIMAWDTDFTGDRVLVGVREPGGIFDTHPQLKGIFHADSVLGADELHGTHVTGIIAGRRKSSILGPWGDTEIKGVAPAAEILYRKWGLLDFQAFKNAGAKISNHSYSFGFLGKDVFSYDSNCKNFDGYCDNDDMVLIISAGNNDPAAIPSPANAKNVITVGAISYVPEGTPDIGKVAWYSDWGPTRDDKRLKPDLVAPGGGDNITEGVVSTNSNPWDLTDKGLGKGKIDNNYTEPEWETDDNYIRASGTSTAPHVAGVCAKMMEWKPDFHSELLKALLINTTIPLKANSSDALAAYANTEVGYGMVNGYSATNYYVGESKMLLFGEGLINQDDDPRYDDWSITVPDGTKKLIVTLAYNDEEGKISDNSVLKDDLDLILITPDAKTEYLACIHKASGVEEESPLEKMVITDPPEGPWTVRIRFTYSPGFSNPLIYAEQRYGVVADAIMKEPALSISVPQTSLSVEPGKPFSLTPSVTNVGGYIAAGVTLKVAGDSKFGGSINTPRYVGNLLYEGASKSATFNLVAPSNPGATYDLEVLADGINQEFETGYPIKQIVRVTVNGDFNCPDCSEGVVQNVTFVSGSNCDCSTDSTLKVGPGVIIQKNAIVNFKAPKIEMQPGFNAEEGSSVKVEIKIPQKDLQIHFDPNPVPAGEYKNGEWYWYFKYSVYNPNDHAIEVVAFGWFNECLSNMNECQYGPANFASWFIGCGAGGTGSVYIPAKTTVCDESWYVSLDPINNDRTGNYAIWYKDKYGNIKVSISGALTLLNP